MSEPPPLSKLGEDEALFFDSVLEFAEREIGPYVRAMDETEWRPMRGGEGALSPTFSPDGSWVAFWTDGRLAKIPSGGGAPGTLSNAARPYGVEWTADDTPFHDGRSTAEGAVARR